MPGKCAVSELRGTLKGLTNMKESDAAEGDHHANIGKDTFKPDFLFSMGTWCPLEDLKRQNGSQLGLRS